MATWTLLVASPHSGRPFDPVAQLGSRAVNRNGPTASFEFEGHQADVIGVSESEFDMARLFYSFGDVGMLLGMMLTAAGIKFGYKGLMLVRPGHAGQLMLSNDRSRVLAWLGFERDKVVGRLRGPAVGVRVAVQLSLVPFLHVRHSRSAMETQCTPRTLRSSDVRALRPIRRQPPAR